MNDRGFLDLLFNTLLVFVFLFIVSSMMIEIEKKKEGIQTKAEYVITVTWELDNPDDVDSWLRDPAGNIIWFRTKEFGLMHLDRDDLGLDNDKYILPDGTEVFYPYNQEITTIRGIVPGMWVFNIHLYRKKEMSYQGTKVEVKMEKLNPKVTTVFIRHYTLHQQGDEVTVARFNMSAAGEIIDMDEIQTAIVTDRLINTRAFP